MSKVLIGLAAVQIAVLLFLAFHVVDLGARLDRVVGDAPTVVMKESGEASPAPAVAARPAAPDASEIRRIVREEMAAALKPAPSDGGASVAPAAAAPTAALKSDVARDFNRYLAQGRISAREMAEFQTKMARLPPAERSAMLRAVTKAMNDGRLEGQF